MNKKIAPAHSLRLSINYPSDEIIIQQLRTSSSEFAFRQILAKYDAKQLLQRYFLRRTRNMHEAQDLCQEVFLILFKNLRDGKYTFQQEGHLARYLLGIARNQWLKAIRHRQRQGWYIGSSDYYVFYLPETPDASDAEQAEAGALETLLVTCLQQQSERSRRLLIGHHVEGYTYEALAKELGYASPQVAKQRCSVKRIELKQEIRKRLSA